MIYGVPGEALIIPTVWALLALRHERDRTELRSSVNWLEKNLTNARGAGSYALARLGLEICEKTLPVTSAAFADFYHRNHFLQSVSVVAWTCLALCNRRKWLNGGIPESLPEYATA